MTTTIEPEENPGLASKLGSRLRQVDWTTQFSRLRSAAAPSSFWLMMMGPSMVAVLWSIFPAVKAIVAVFLIAFGPSVIRSLNSGTASSTEVRRDMQRYFGRFEVYIPLDDIVVKDPVASFSSRGLELNELACHSSGVMSVWVPIRVRLPFVGDVVWEWCWIPKVSKLM